MLHHDVLDRVAGEIGIVLVAENHGVDFLRDDPLVDDRDLTLGIRAKAEGRMLVADVGRLAHQRVGDRNGERHHVDRFVGRHAEHHALVAGTTGVDADRDVRRLLLNRDHDTAGVSVVAECGIRVADGVDCVADDLGDVDVAFNRDFAGDDRESSGQEGFDRDAGGRVLSETIVEERVGNLVRKLIRVSLADALGRVVFQFCHGLTGG